MLIAHYITSGHAQSYCDGGHIAILLCVSGYNDTFCMLFASQHYHSTFANISVTDSQASNIQDNGKEDKQQVFTLSGQVIYVLCTCHV